MISVSLWFHSLAQGWFCAFLLCCVHLDSTSVMLITWSSVSQLNFKAIITTNCKQYWVPLLAIMFAIVNFNDIAKYGSFILSYLLKHRIAQLPFSSFTEASQLQMMMGPNQHRKLNGLKITISGALATVTSCFANCMFVCNCIQPWNYTGSIMEASSCWVNVM